MGLGKQIVRCKQVELIAGEYLGRHIFHYVGRALYQDCIFVVLVWFVACILYSRIAINKQDPITKLIPIYSAADGRSPHPSQPTSVASGTAR